ncbi:hypothetical protein ACO0K7_00955 [Undibacterium sp. Ji67W]|uniref:hypothetical protein n=1 Tax=Undibacterium sp. Ji67W TaxID=3413042 RepID=UPI003BF210EB
MDIVHLGRSGLLRYLENQLSSFFPDGKNGRDVLEKYIDEALVRTGNCINRVKMWTPDTFNYLHSTQYCMFLYFLSNSIHRNEHQPDICTKLFYLNKALNGIDLFYEIEMPPVFFIGHSVGIVLAKATYGNYLVLYQNSTVGKNHGAAPILGEGVIMYPNSAIIGDCKVADRSVISQGVSVISRDTQANSLVFQKDGGELVFKKDQRDILADFFRF